MRVHWTNNAIEHLIAIYEYITKDAPFYAQRMVDRVTKRSKQIAAFPLSGRKVTEYQKEDVYEVLEGPYRIIYRIRSAQIDVLAVIHGARLLPPEF